MTRRTLLGFLPACLVPRPFTECGRPAHTKSPALPDSTDTTPAPVIPSNLLDAWLRLPLRPILDANLLALADQAIASRMLERIAPGQSFEFIYQGGSEPGSRRRVLPVLVFQKLNPDLPATATLTNHAYLLAFCQTRNAPRTFRLDRIQVCECSVAL